MVVVGIFDDARTLDEAASRLTDAGHGDDLQRFEGPLGPGAAGGAGASEGAANPIDMSRSEAVNAPWPDALRASERPRFGGAALDDEEWGYYEQLLRDGGRLLMVEIAAEKADGAAAAMEDAGASRVVTHHR